ncbi:MAG: hypothetical protein QOF41_3240, partial [Methylobacteriaceae bacterium]|nr:hypothetical protein [Methylobacteriaceae bacterium]
MTLPVCGSPVRPGTVTVSEGQLGT